MLCSFPERVGVENEQMENLTPPRGVTLFIKRDYSLTFFLPWCRHFAATLKTVTTFYLVIGQILIEGFLCVRNGTEPQNYRIKTYGASTQGF